MLVNDLCVCVPLQCLNKILLYCDNLPTNYTCPPFFGPVSVVLHFQVLHFHVSSFLVPHFQVLHFQSTRLDTQLVFEGERTSITRAQWLRR